MKILAGFRYDTRRRSARLEVILPGTGAKVRRRRSIENVSRDEALTAWKAFREEILSGSPRPDPVTFAGYVERLGSLIEARLSER